MALGFVEQVAQTEIEQDHARCAQEVIHLAEVVE